MSEIMLPTDLKPPEGAKMTFWTIYERPGDYPHGYVLATAPSKRDGAGCRKPGCPSPGRAVTVSAADTASSCGT